MPSQNETRQAITAPIVEALKKRWPPALEQAVGHRPERRFPLQHDGQKVPRHQSAPPPDRRHAVRFPEQVVGNLEPWHKVGGKVMKRPDDVPPGEWGTPIIFWSKMTKTEENDHGVEEQKDIFFLKTFVVFNVEQVAGADLDVFRIGHSPVQPKAPFVAYEEADRVIEATGADIRYGGNQAFYSRNGDYIQVPLREQFTAPEYYETVLHEVCHWSESRLHWNRTNTDTSYSMGELIAEMGSCFLATELGIPNADKLPNHASYLQYWLKAMENDHRFIFQAATQANRAADFILSFSRKTVEEPEESLAE